MIAKLKNYFRERLSSAEREIGIKMNEVIGYINDFGNPINLNTSNQSVNWNYLDGYNAELLLDSNKTISFSNLNKGAYGTLKVIQDAVGSRTLTLPSNSKVSGGGSGIVSLSASAGYVDIVTFYYDGVNMYWNVSLNFS
jgi:hypothetical protein